MSVVNFAKNCGAHTFNSLFPEDIENKGLVYALNILHIIGVVFIQFGILLPHKYLIFYIGFLMMLFVSYYLFNNWLSPSNCNNICSLFFQNRGPILYSL